MEDIHESSDLETDIFQVQLGSLAPSDTQVIEVEFIGFDEIEAGEGITKESLLEVGRKEVGHVEGRMSLPGSKVRGLPT